MTKFTLFVAAAVVFSPLAAYAGRASPAVPSSVPTVMISAHNSGDLSYQVAHLNGQVLTLNNEVEGLQQQSTAGSDYVPELAGVIPSGG